MLNNESLSTVTMSISELSTGKLEAVEGSLLDQYTSEFIERSEFVLSEKSISENTLEVKELIEVIRGTVLPQDSQEDGIGGILNNELVKPLANIIRSNVWATRNVVLPLIDQYTNELNEEINKRAGAAGMALVIHEDKALSILDNPTLANAVADAPVRFVSGNGILPRLHNEKTVDELYALIRTGRDAFDIEVLNWIKDNNLEEKMVDTFRNIFAHSTGRAVYLNRYFDAKDYAASVFTLLMAWGLSRNIESVPGVSLEQYELNMSETISNASRTINLAIANYKEALASKQLVSAYPKAGAHLNFKDPHEIVVIPAVYREFLNSGAPVEAIFGAFIVDRTMSLTKILANQAEYVKAHDKALALNKSTKANDIVRVMRDFFSVLSGKVLDDIKALIGEDKEDVSSRYESAVPFVPQIDDFIRGLNIYHADNIYNTVRCYICDIFFADSKVNDIISKIDYLSEESNEEADINYLATIACIDIVVEWLLEQITATPVVQN